MATTKYPFNGNVSSTGTIAAEQGETAQTTIGDVTGGSVAGIAFGSAVDALLLRTAAGIVAVTNVLQFPEAAAPSGASDVARVGARDVSAATELYVIFPTGAVIPLAREGVGSIAQSVIATDTVALAAGTTTLDPLLFTAGTNLTTPVAGALEYDGKAFYSTTAAGRGVASTVQLAAIQADLTLSDVGTVQTGFPTANDQLSIQADTAYSFDGQYILNTGTTTHTTGLAWTLASGASVTSFEYTADAWSAAANTIATPQCTHVSGTTTKVVTATSTAVYTIIKYRGIARINAGGTIRPGILFSAAPGGTNLMKVGSYVRFTPIGSGTVAAVGPWA